MDRLTVTVSELSQILGVNRTAAYFLVRRSDFPSIRIGKRIVIPKVALLRWLDQTAGGDFND